MYFVHIYTYDIYACTHVTEEKRENLQVLPWVFYTEKNIIIGTTAYEGDPHIIPKEYPLYHCLGKAIDIGGGTV